MSNLTPPVHAADHIQGTADSPVTLVEYGDFECPYCGAMYPVVKAVQQAMGNRLRFVFRQFPLTSMHPHALHAAQMSEAAAAVGRFWEAHDLLYENQGALNDAALSNYAAHVGVSASDLKSAFEGAYDERIQRDFDGGLHSGVNGTPSLFINGRRYDGDRDARSLLEALDAAAAGA
ncbi:protein-disulfide isomerase [Paraburkholderia tropica]|uniref:DsbA family protein n=1 Tax=Paraburkholderia tropica TaxID=92647 RepID=UPI00161DDEE1|nr:DsbA family protein [Paraburkholderia tropica]MBB3001483.1 protein-disulfide isomerase [Paraburkholderia tropica]MBB6322798.1 protein-disulfide isomerase [Paraburkholderia tropica]